MFFRFTLRALQYRKQRLLLAFSALAVAATLATVLFGIYSSADRRIREEFRSYGANVDARPAAGNTVPLAVAAAARKHGAEAVPFLVKAVPLQPGSAEGETIAVVGFEPGATASQMTLYWHVAGSRDIGPGDCLAGELLAGRLGWQTGQQIDLPELHCTLRGIVSTGGSEDQEVLMGLRDLAPELSGPESDSAARVSFVEIRVPGNRMEAVRELLAAEFPGVDFRTVRSVTQTESNVVVKVRAAILLLTLVILAITTLCVSSNFTEMVIERSKEIGILKALGGVERRIAGFIVSESTALAVAATLTGYGVGILAAAAVGRQIFGEGFHLQADWRVFAGVMVVMLTVAALATAIATSRIWKIQPATILRGE